MSVTQYVNALKKRWRWVAVPLLACIAIAFGYNETAPKVYVASTEIFVAIAGTDNSLQQLAQGNSFTQARVQSYAEVATSPKVTQAVVDELHLGMSANSLSSKITAVAPANKVLIDLQVSDGDAGLAAALANAVSEQFALVVEAIEKADTSSASPVNLTVIKPATIPSAPSSPRVDINIILGAIVGLLLGLLAAAVRDFTDNTMKTADELARYTHVPVLGTVPFDRMAEQEVLAFRGAKGNNRAEAFRQLRTNLQFVDVDRPPRVIAVTSANPAEGKSHTALNLAVALSEGGRRVCLMEADLRKPSVAISLGLVGDVGLTSILAGQALVEDVLQNAGPNLAVMTSGAIPPNPSELLLSEQCRRTIEYVADRVDVVIIDTAPLLPVSDGAEIAAVADATVLVVRAGKTTRDQVRRAVEQLRNVGVVPVGSVLSMSRARSSGYSYYYEPNVDSSRMASQDAGAVLTQKDE